jgi:hypothetical protein
MSKKDEQKEDRKKQFLEILENNAGVIKAACDAMNIGRRTVYDWRDQDPKFREAIEDIKEGLIDFAESQLMRLMTGVVMLAPDGSKAYKKEPCKTSIIFYLKTQGRKRGYVEGYEVTNYNPEGKPKWLDGEEIETE